MPEINYFWKPFMSRGHVVPKMADVDHIMDGANCIQLS